MSDAMWWFLVGIPIGGLVVGVIGYALGRPEPEFELLTTARDADGRECRLALDVGTGRARKLSLRYERQGRIIQLVVDGLPNDAPAALRWRAMDELLELDRAARPPLPVGVKAKVRDAS